MRERLVVDPIKCTAHGMCAELFPEWIELDEWGYPIVRPDAVPPHLREHAVEAVRACPTMALSLSPAGDDREQRQGKRKPAAKRSR
ncbi:MAG: ferredoxin [Thermoleophilaceae bacterium]|jgi:ferredoxin|nr:ferredoxin [Thermoleophilaceae bacterium]